MTSVWSDSIKGSEPQFPALSGKITTDVLIIGGGMAGILTAHKLKEAGVNCVIAEGKNIGSGITKNTTAKITAQHGLIYADLIKRFGKEKAKLHYDANTRAIKSFEELSRTYPCDFEQQTAYVYSCDDSKKLEREAKAYRKLGINTIFKENPPLPIKTVGALGLKRQAQFNPLKLLTSLSAGLEIYENSFIYKLDSNIDAKHIILATHFPLVNIPGLYFLKLYQHRSYVIAAEVAEPIDGMYVDERKDGHSFRMYKNLLFIGGGDHKTGKRGKCFMELRELARLYPNSHERYSWSTQDCMSLDGLPYIGRHRRGKSNLYVATGFNKWGMSGSMVAANLLRDLIVYGKSELEDLYSPQRSIFRPQLALNALGAAAGLLSIGGPRCAHMGCKLHYNKLEGTWDCSCHGSRFNKDGSVIDNPAKRPLRM
jgi:glycine/D-amino acid oxidase-like deaminating enzyme